MHVLLVRIWKEKWRVLRDQDSVAQLRLRTLGLGGSIFNTALAYIVLDTLRRYTYGCG